MINNGSVLKCIELNTFVLSTVSPRKFSMEVPKNTLSNTYSLKKKAIFILRIYLYKAFMLEVQIYF